MSAVCNNDYVNNSLYWNGEKGKCYISAYNVVTDCDFTNTNMPENLKILIDTVTWNTGSQDGSYTTEYENGEYDTMNVNKFYEIERSNNTGKMCDGGDYCNDEVERTTSWKGKVGLMYSSDYGYATSGGETGNRITCLNTPLSLWYDILHEEDPAHHFGCYENDWLLTSHWDWTLSPETDSTQAASEVFAIADIGGISYIDAYSSNNVRPSVYLKPDVLVSSGNGSKKSPYVLSGN